MRPLTALVAVLLIATAMSAPSASATTKTARSLGCSWKFSQQLRSSWACSTLIGPSGRTMQLGVPFEVTLRFRARKTLTNVTLHISKPNDGFHDVWKRKFRRITRGRTIAKTVSMVLQPSPGSNQPLAISVFGYALSPGNAWRAQLDYDVAATPA